MKLPTDTNLGHYIKEEAETEVILSIVQYDGEICVNERDKGAKITQTQKHTGKRF